MLRSWKRCVLLLFNYSEARCSIHLLERMAQHRRNIQNVHTRWADCCRSYRMRATRIVDDVMLIPRQPTDQHFRCCDSGKRHKCAMDDVFQKHCCTWHGTSAFHRIPTEWDRCSERKLMFQRALCTKQNKTESRTQLENACALDIYELETARVHERAREIYGEHGIVNDFHWIGTNTHTHTHTWVKWGKRDSTKT